MNGAEWIRCVLCTTSDLLLTRREQMFCRRVWNAKRTRVYDGGWAPKRMDECSNKAWFTSASHSGDSGDSASDSALFTRYVRQRTSKKRERLACQFIFQAAGYKCTLEKLVISHSGSRILTTITHTMCLWDISPASEDCPVPPPEPAGSVASHWAHFGRSAKPRCFPWPLTALPPAVDTLNNTTRSVGDQGGSFSSLSGHEAYFLSFRLEKAT